MKTIFLFIFCSISLFCFANGEQKNVQTIRATTPPTIDGKPDDACWQQVKAAELHYQFAPFTGAETTEKTEVKIIYDNAAIYVLAICYDKHPDSIQHVFTTRDNIWEQTDNIFVFFDTYHDGQNAYSFGVSVDNVQTDFKASQGGNNIDNSWDAVWESKTQMMQNGWCAEFKIPYSAIRFPKTKTQNWTCDFTRQIRHFQKKEICNWCEIPPTTNAFVSKMQALNGIENIKPPLRLSISPYASAYALSQGTHVGQAFRGGADIKYGISESFTLDMTLVPDFGQVVSDNVVKNLSPYEIEYEEKRPFFLEGAELFSKNDLFYSRRVGKITNYFWDKKENQNLTVNDEPTQSKLLNAFKLSGKTKNNLSVGVFNAVTNNMYVQANDSNGSGSKQLFEPLTNYNILVLEKTLKNNSHIGFINTNVIRTHHGNDANVSGIDFKLLDKSNTYFFTSQINYSSIFNNNKTDSSTFIPQSGSRIILSGGKQTGMWHAFYSIDAASDKYNSNDLGFLARNNFIHQQMIVRQIITKPFRKLLNMNNMLSIEQENNFNNQQLAYYLLFGRSKFDLKNYTTLVFYAATKPMIQKDFYDPRVFGRFVNLPKVYQVGNYLSSDYRKTFALDASTDFVWFDEYNRNKFTYAVIPRLKLGSKFLMNYEFENSFSQNEKGFVQKNGDVINFGKRNVKEITNTLSLHYIFTNKMSLATNARYYYSGGRYSQYYNLQQDGNLQPIADNLNADFDFNAWTLDVVYSWFFAPGSQLTFAVKNVIYHEPTTLPFLFNSNLDATFKQPFTNSVSLKVLYYLDAGKWKKS